MAEYKRTRLRSLPVRERPTYRVTDHGVTACALQELLAVVVGGPRQIEIAEAILTRYQTLPDLARASIQELLAQQVEGLGPSRAAQIQAALELGRRLMLTAPEERTQIRSPNDAATLAMAAIGHEEQEHFLVLFLDVRNRMLGSEVVYKGSINETHVRVCEVFREAVRRNCAAIICVHNHPSGDPTPSPEDVAMTRELVQAGDLLGIEVFDHIIVSGNKWLSLKERGLGFEGSRK